MHCASCLNISLIMNVFLLSKRYAVTKIKKLAEWLLLVRTKLERVD